MEEKIKKLIATILNVSQEEITLDTEIGELDEWDSLHNMEIIAALEKTFNVKITPTMLIDLEDVSDIIDLIEELTK